MLNILRTSLRTARATISYPDQHEASACRGMPQVDASRCDCPGACVPACPADAIAILRNTHERRWQVDLARCVFCGLCQESCPNGALNMTNEFELASRTREGLVRSVTLGPSSIGLAAGPAASPAGSDREPSRVPNCPATEANLFSIRVRKLLKRSLHIRHMAAGSDNSCDWEIAHLLNPVYDIQRLGIDFVASPRHADLLMVTGAVTRNLEPALYATYEAMPAPRLVAAVGSEACGGGVLHGSYAIAGGVDKCLPVDVYIPGDPPRPQALIHGLLIALDRLEPQMFHG